MLGAGGCKCSQDPAHPWTCPRAVDCGGQSPLGAGTRGLPHPARLAALLTLPGCSGSVWRRAAGNPCPGVAPEPPRGASPHHQACRTSGLHHLPHAPGGTTGSPGRPSAREGPQTRGRLRGRSGQEYTSTCRTPGAPPGPRIYMPGAMNPVFPGNGNPGPGRIFNNLFIP